MYNITSFKITSKNKLADRNIASIKIYPKRHERFLEAIHQIKSMGKVVRGMDIYCIYSLCINKYLPCL